MEVENLSEYKNETTFSGCVIITVPGRDGFLWLEPSGLLHNAGMDIKVHSGKVQVLWNEEGGKMSYGWMAE